MKRSYCLILLTIFCLGIAGRAIAAETPAQKWEGLLDVTYKFSWYPQADLKKLLDLKATENGQSLQEYRDRKLEKVTGGKSPEIRVAADGFITGLPWRDYYRLALAEYCLFLVTDQPDHLHNAQAALSVLGPKADRPEIQYWNYVFKAQQACLDKDRMAFIQATYHIWQDVILRMEIEAVSYPSEGAQVGFVRSLPYLYENVAHLVIRRAIIEQEIPNLWPLSALILDIQPKLTVKNGYKTMVDQVVERMRGPGSDNKNINFAVALLQATSKRYDFEDEKDKTLLPSKYNEASRYYQLAYDWASTPKGKMAILTQQMGFLNYTLSRFSDHREMLVSKQFFGDLPPRAGDKLTKAVQLFDKFAAPSVQKEAGRAEGFTDRGNYLQGMHRLWDSTAKLAIVLSDFYQAGHGANNIFAAVQPLKTYFDQFNRYALSNAAVLPDNAYFQAAYAAKQMGSLYRERARFNVDQKDDARAFAYQFAAAEIFPLDIPDILQLAYQASLDGQARKYFHASSPLGTHLRTSRCAQSWPSRNANAFGSMLALVPTVVPAVLNQPFGLLEHLPKEEISEDKLFSRVVAMVRNGDAASQKQLDPAPSASVKGDPVGGNSQVSASGGEKFPFFDLKSQLYGSPESPIHNYLRTLFNEVPFQNHQYVILLHQLG